MSKSFADLGVSKPVVRALAARGIETPFAIQSLVVADVLAGRDVLAQSPTGSGKTLAFGVPLLERIEPQGRGPAALVLAPTRELANQIVEELDDVARARNLRVAAVYGGVGYETQTRRAQKAHVIVATPGRLEDLLERRAFALDRVRILVLDEADRMLDMGFRPAVDRIVAQCPRDRQTLFFSATLDGEAGAVASRTTRDAVRRIHRPDAAAKADIVHRFVAAHADERVEVLLRELGHAGRELALVFVRTKRGADRLAKRLAREGVDAVAMHGDKSQRQRERALARFEAWEVTTLVATDVAARGIDVADITHVINFDPPGDTDTYVHRVGRTGRAGRTGTGVTLVGAEHAKDVGRIAHDLRLHDEFGDTGFAHALPRAQAATARPQGAGQRSGGPRRGGRSRQRSRAR